MKKKLLSFSLIIGIILGFNTYYNTDIYASNNIYLNEVNSSSQLSDIEGLKHTGTTYAMTQEAVFLDSDHYAVGRWDGSLSIFKFSGSLYQGPLIVHAVTAPAKEGVQMIVPLTPYKTAFISSNDSSSIAVWESRGGQWDDLDNTAILTYDQKYGVANRSITVTVDEMLYLVVGHENGFVSIWQNGPGVIDWTFVTATDVRSDTPVNPWNLHNIRGIVKLDDNGTIITGSEDGNLTVLKVPSGEILSSTVFNPNAQRGINNIAIHEDILLVANCSVGIDDFNTWSYKINSETLDITLVDKVNLKINQNAAQVFNFDVVFGPTVNNLTRFFASTEEGILWGGTVDESGIITIDGYKVISGELGSALSMNDNRLIAISYDLHEFIYE